MVLRILTSVLLLISILFWPFWLSVILALAAMVYFNLFMEAVPLFLISDLLYGAKETSPFGIVFISFFMSLVFLVAIELLKKRLKFYP